MKYYIIAGEASGDLHGANLMKGIYRSDPDASIRFWGGDLMNEVHAGAAGADTDGGLVRHYRDGAIMGFWEVFAKAGKLLGNISFCKRDIMQWGPDAVILIDYPGFNFKIAEFVHKKGIRTFYYIAPKVWASREGRIRKLKEYVDRLYIVFPFEIPYFREKGINAVYKGNPLVDAVADSPALNESRAEFLKRTGLEDRPIIALLAGSRKGEISTMMPVFADFVKKMRQIPQYRDWLFIVAGAPSRDISDYSPYMDSADKDFIVLFGETRSIIRHAEAAVVNSGTASLETVLLDTPQVVGYISNRLSYMIAKKIIRVRYISLGNLILDRLAFRELIQDDCNVSNIMDEVRRLIEDSEYRSAMLSEYALIRKALGGRGASEAVASDMVQELERSLISPRR